MPVQVFHRELSSRFEEVSALAEQLSGWFMAGGVPQPVASAAVLMVDELLTNTVMHGYAGRADGWIEVEAEVNAAGLRVVLRDHAPAFDPTRSPVPDTTESLEARPIGGLGLLFVRRMADRFTYQRAKDARGRPCNEVRLAKAFAPTVRPGRPPEPAAG